MYLDECVLEKEYKIKDMKDFPLKLRLFELGFLKGATIKPILESPFKNPRAYLIKGSVFALRNEDAHFISVIE